MGPALTETLMKVPAVTPTVYRQKILSNVSELNGGKGCCGRGTDGEEGNPCVRSSHVANDDQQVRRRLSIAREAKLTELGRKELLSDRHRDCRDNPRKLQGKGGKSARASSLQGTSCYAPA